MLCLFDFLIVNLANSFESKDLASLSLPSSTERLHGRATLATVGPSLQRPPPSMSGYSHRSFQRSPRNVVAISGVRRLCYRSAYLC